MALLLGMFLVIAGALGVGLGLTLAKAGGCVALGGLLLLVGARRRQRHESSAHLPAVPEASHHADVRRHQRAAAPTQSTQPTESTTHESPP